MQSDSKPKLTFEIKKLIADQIKQGNTDEAIIASHQTFAITSDDIKSIRDSIERASNLVDIRKPAQVHDAFIGGDLPRMYDGMCPVGGQVVIIGKDGVLQSRSEGTKTPGGDEPVNNETQIGIGSVTKLFTAVALFNIIDKEKKDLEDGKIVEGQGNFQEGLDTKLSSFMDKLSAKYPDCKYLQQIQQMPDYENITLRNLLEHTSGLHKRDDYDLAIEQLSGKPLPKPEEILNYTTKEPTVHGKYDYNNIGYELLGMVMSVATKKPHEEVFKENVFDKFALENTSLKTDETANRGGGVFRIDDVKNENGGTLISAQYMDFTENGNSWFAGGIQSSAQDVAKFMENTFMEDTFSSRYMKQEMNKIKEGREGFDRGKDDGSKCVNGFNVLTDQDGKIVIFHYGDNATSHASACYKDGEVSVAVALGQNISIKLADEILKQDHADRKIDTDLKITDELRLPKIKELEEKGFNFKKINDLLKEGKSFSEIAKEVKGIPSTSPTGASTPPLTRVR